MSDSKKLYLIDGSGFIFRAYHSLPPLTNPQGVPVGAVYGFVNMIMKLVEGTKTDYLAVIFDAGRKTFRNRIYDQYKANRPEPPEDLIPQFPLVRAATEALNLPAIDLVDYEADDLIATYTCLARERGIEVVIVSSDKDLMQLIAPGVSMFDAMKQRTIGDAEVMEKFGVPPNKVLEVLSLIGDTSDHVPGVPSIGPKTAAELINQFGDIETLLSRTSEIKQQKRREVLETHADAARLSRRLIALDCSAPVPVPIEELVLRQPDKPKLLTFLREHGFKRLLEKFGETYEAPVIAKVDKTVANYALVQSEDALKQWIARAKAQGVVAFDTETTALDAMQAQLVGVSLGLGNGEACYIPVGHVEPGSVVATPTATEVTESGMDDLFTLRPNLDDKPSVFSTGKLIGGQLPLDTVLRLLKPLLADPSVLKIGQNIKYDMLVLKKYGVEIAAFDDTMLCSYVLAAGLHAHNMDDLAERYLAHKTISYDEVTGSGRNRISFAEVALDKALAYAAEDADVTWNLHQVLKPQLFEQHLLRVYDTIERPLVPVLVKMEERGIRIDPTQLKAMSEDFARRMVELESEIHTLAGSPFNIGSPKQLGEILFDKMQLPGGKKSGKTGAYVTDASVLEELAEQGHALPEKVLEWRQIAKLKSTYTDALKEQINPQTKRVHTSFAMAVASTGRLSSSDPNLQNIPIRTEEGRKIRRAFIAAPGTKLLSADYSQIELRLLADIADIPSLKSAFQNGDDIHAITASQMFGVPVSEVNGDLRRKAKTINFGIIYGISAHGLAMRLGIGRSEAAAYIDQYFTQYPGIREYMERTKAFARQHAYVTTLFGRRCHVPGILDKNPNRRNFSERAAINAPLQGTAADIIKRAMIQIERELTEKQLGTKMILQVHDELVFEVPEAEANIAPPLVKKLMEHAAQISVPLEVETGLGDNWGDIH